MKGRNIGVYCSRKLLDTKYLISALQEHEKLKKKKKKIRYKQYTHNLHVAITNLSNYKKLQEQNCIFNNIPPTTKRFKISYRRV